MKGEARRGEGRGAATRPGKTGKWKKVSALLLVCLSLGSPGCPRGAGALAAVPTGAAEAAVAPGRKGPAAFGSRVPALEAALSLLEAGNPFLASYNRQTGAELGAAYPLGLPYFFGGRAERNLMRVMQPWSGASRYYRKERFYIYGYDCVGFIAHCLKKAGKRPPPSLSGLFADRRAFADREIRADGLGYPALAALLQPGDLLALHKKSGFHTALFAGTLRDYGYTEENLPAALAPYLDYPLIVHSGENPFYYGRYEDYIAATYKITKVTPPDGGATVSLLGVPAGRAPDWKAGRTSGHGAAYFWLSGYPLTVYDTSEALGMRWYRWE